MRRATNFIMLCGAAIAGACSMQGGPSTTGPAARASSDLVDSSGRKVGTATATQVGSDISIRVEATSLPAGLHGVHVHTTGVCTAPDFASAGGHWNSTAHQHGKDNPAGMHIGDLPNLEAGADGRGTIEYRIAGATINGGASPLLDADGAAIVIHAAADDYRTDPSGNSGSRIACGIFR